MPIECRQSGCDCGSPRAETSLWQKEEIPGFSVRDTRVLGGRKGGVHIHVNYETVWFLCNWVDG